MNYDGEKPSTNTRMAGVPQGDDIAAGVKVCYGGGVVRVVIVPERSERDTVRAATIGRGVQGRVIGD